MTVYSHNEYQPSEVSPPRETLRELLDERRMSHVELAKRMGKTVKAVTEILSRSADVSITPETALQLEHSLGLPARFWLNREQAYREAKARGTELAEHERDVDWLDCLPLAGLRKRGYINEARKTPQAVREALSFFGVATVASWNLFWSSTEVSYRISTAFTSEAGHLAAWLRCGELEAAKLSCRPYDVGAFQTALIKIRTLTTESCATMVSQVQGLAAAAGVAVVFVPEFPKTHVCGAARWIDGGRLPVLQLSLRHKTDDHLWFTFFHEACHLLRHAKKPIYVDDESPEGARIEEEANRFARNLLIPEARYDEFVSGHDSPRLSSIMSFAESIGIAPGVVIGRLQHDGRLDRRVGNGMKRRFGFDASGMVVEYS